MALAAAGLCEFHQHEHVERTVEQVQHTRNFEFRSRLNSLTQSTLGELAAKAWFKLCYSTILCKPGQVPTFQLVVMMMNASTVASALVALTLVFHLPPARPTKPPTCPHLSSLHRLAAPLRSRTFHGHHGGPRTPMTMPICRSRPRSPLHMRSWRLRRMMSRWRKSSLKSWSRPS